MEEIRRILNLLIDNPFEEKTLLDLYSFYKKHNLSEIHIKDNMSKTLSYTLEGHLTEKYMSTVQEPSGITVWHNQICHRVIHSQVYNRDIFTFFRKPNGTLSVSAYHNLQFIYIMEEAMNFCIQERLLNGKMVRIE